MRYSDFIEVNESFQTSINLDYDLNRIEKIKSYIPTEQSVRILGIFLRSFYYNNNQDGQNRASVLIGPYGRGKSHLLLVLTALTSIDLFRSDTYSLDDAKEAVEGLCKKISAVDEEVGALATAVYNNNIRTLPIIIDSNTNDINQAFLISIKDALERANIDSLLPNTYFDAAIEVLDKWKESYPEVIKQLGIELKKNKRTVDDMYEGLKRFEQEAYTEFCELYPNVAAGTIFNPLANMDIVKLYLAVVNALCEQTDYSGINIIFDEFSKFLETNLDKSKMLNFKIIQDMAEAATRSGSKQIHFTCITHKDILDYSTSDSFKTVEGRFNKIYYIASSEQSYELIANAIPKKKAFNSFVEKYKDSFDKSLGSASMIDVFTDMSADSFEKKVVKGCFPLSPISAYSLLHISELVGQNERTLFTFLAKEEPYSLIEFLVKERDSVDFVTVDKIYDYFEELFKKEVFNTTVHSIWRKTDSAIRQIKDDDQKRILKAIAIISMIGDENLKTLPSHIKTALMLDDEAFTSCIVALQKQHIVSQRDSSEYVLLTANGVDIQKNVDDYILSKISKINRVELLEDNFPLGFIIPREYNDKYSMIRFFKRIYVEERTFLAYQSGDQILKDYPYDGVIMCVLPAGEDRRALVDHASRFVDNPEIVVCLSTYQCDLDLLLKKVVATNALKMSELADDPHYLEEIEVFEEDYCKQIRNAIDMFFSPASRYSSYFNSKGELQVLRQIDLNHEISRICLNRYSKTPVINNEMVNKSHLNAQNLKGRNIAVEWVLDHADDEVIPCMPGYGPEVSIFKAAYAHTGLASSNRVNDAGINEVLDIIENFITNSEENASSFALLYTILETAPYSLRKGIIPLFIAYVLRKYKKSVVLYFKGKEVELSANALSAVNDNNSDYSLLIEKGTKEREEYLDCLEDMFKPYADPSYSGTNRVYAIVRNMQTWVRSLPEYTKRFNSYYCDDMIVKVDANTKLIRSDLLKFELNARDMLLEHWIKKLSPNGDYSECSNEIKRVKELLDTHLSEYKEHLICKMTELLMPGYSGTLSNALKLWVDSLPVPTKEHVFDASSNALLMIAQNWKSFDDQRLLNELSLAFVSMAIEDWTDGLAVKFKSTFETSLERINNYVGSANEEKESKLSIDLAGTQIEKSFSEIEISPIGRTALNNLKSVFEEYNGSLEPDEQLAIIATLIRDIIKDGD